MYCTDLEETQWQVIKKILNQQERNRKYDLREICENGTKAEASLGIMDSQSVCWDDNRSLNGIDGNKKIKELNAI